MKKRDFLITAALLGMAISPGCGSYSLTPPVPTQENCPAQVAQIRIGDGWSEVLCGCKSEAPGTVTPVPAPLNCTVDSGTQVYFRFETSQTWHQIAPAPGGLSFPQSAPAMPEDPITQAPWPVTFTAPGNYDYIDVYSPTQVRGRIVVQ